MFRAATLAFGLLLLAFPAMAKDNLGVFDNWAAFRDPAAPRCYAIAAAESSRNRRDYDPFASIGTWPRLEVRSQVHFRLSRKLASRSAISLRIGNRRFSLTGGGGGTGVNDVGPQIGSHIDAGDHQIDSHGDQTHKCQNNAIRGGAPTGILPFPELLDPGGMVQRDRM